MTRKIRMTMIGIALCMFLATGLWTGNGAMAENTEEQENIIIPDGVSSIEESAFEDCTSVKNVMIPDGVTSIGKNAFKGCTGLTGITIPDSVTSIGDGIFSGCTSLASVTFGGNTFTLNDAQSMTQYAGTFFLTDSDGRLDIFGTGSIPDYPSASPLENKSISKAVIWPGITGIGDYTFNHCSTLTEVTIPDSVTSIGRYAFCQCEGLREITIPGNGTVIGEWAFVHCDSLENVTIQSGAAEIGQSAFMYCQSLESIVIPVSVTSIGRNAFDDCSETTGILFEGSSAEWSAAGGKSRYPVRISTGGYTLICPKYRIRKVLFSVANGCWDDGTSADKTVLLSSEDYSGVSLSPDDIPAVGNNPDEFNQPGEWDVEPSTETVITEDVHYTYTYAIGHNWIYTAEGNTITAVCTEENCPYHTDGFTVTMDASESCVYGEIDYEADITASFQYYERPEGLEEAPVRAEYTYEPTETISADFDDLPYRYFWPGDYTEQLTWGTATITNSFTVSPKEVTVAGVQVDGGIYDGSTAATIRREGTLEGLLSGDDDGYSVLIVPGEAVFEDANAGAGKPVICSGWSLAGEKRGCYALIQPTGVLGQIAPKTLTISGLSVENKVYDGTTAAPLSGTPLLVGVIAGDDVSLVQGTAQFEDPEIGTGKTVTFSGWELEGDDQANYFLEQPESATADITAAGFTVTVSASPAEWGTVTGGGTYAAGSTATLTAVPAQDFHFIRWTENDVSVSTDNPYAFTVSQDTELVAHFGQGSMPRVATPVFSLAAGEYTTSQSLTITCETEDAVIYYTMDGTTPTTDSAVCSGPIELSSDTVIKAFAVRSGMYDSEVATAGYWFTGPTWAQLQGMFNTASTDADSPTTIRLMQDVIPSSENDNYLEVAAGTYVILDLNGRTINRGLTEGITGGYASSPSAVC